MGLFSKLKTFVGANAPKIEFERVEDEIPITDTGVKYNIKVSGEQKCTITSVTSTLQIEYINEEGEERVLDIASDDDDGEYWIESQNPFPGIVDPSNDWEYAGSIFMDDDKSEMLQKLYQNKSQSKVKLKLVVDVDVKEVGALFDPSIEREIVLLSN
ncbi:MAG: hypothetical protein MRY83_07050 [Flavobacteriales bacterium]|nr:hypothetical protein [Flavobacteriales bacterium]